MSSAFLLAFARAVVTRLADEEQVVVVGDRHEEVVVYVATFLGGRTGHRSLISSLSEGLLACPDVEELYADDEHLKQIVNDLGAGG